jgi:hypothetical protein
MPSSTNRFLMVGLATILVGCEGLPGTTAPPPNVQASGSVSATSTNQPPVAELSWTSTEACCGCYEFTFDGSGSYDPDGHIARWDWYEDGSLVQSGSSSSYKKIYLRVYEEGGKGEGQGMMVVTDDAGATDSAGWTFTLCG